MPTASLFPPLPTLARLGLALALGLFVGLEREWRHKEAGLRTFGLAAMLCCMGGLLGTDFAMLSIALLGVLLGFLNWHAIHAGHKAELTTSVALLVVGFVGVLVGQGHTFTPVAVAAVSAGLLAWKEQLAEFSIGLSVVELRSAILLAVLAFVVYPVLPRGAIDPWGYVEPRAAWVTVLLIAGIGFTNYVLLKNFGARGVQITGFLGGLVNSTVTVTELATRARDGEAPLADLAYRGVLLATCAMAARNAVLLGIVAVPALFASFIPLVLILAASFALAVRRKRDDGRTEAVPTIPLRSPFSLSSAIKFGALFLVFQIGGTIAQRLLGQAGFYVVSAVGGVVSSASAVASAAMLAAQGKISPEVAGIAAVLASLASAVVNLALVVRIAGNRPLQLRMARAMAFVVVLGLLGAAVQGRVPARLEKLYGASLGARFGQLAK